MVLAKYGENTEIDENAAGDTVIRNTATGTEVLLSDFVDIVGGVGSSSNRVGGTSFFDGLDANSVNTDDEIINNSSTRPLDTGVIGDNPTDYADQSGEILRQSVDQIEVSTSPTAIADIRGSAYMIVIGTSNLDDVGGKRFIDRVTAFGFGGESATELATSGVPDARTYSTDGNELDLAMAADTYKVNVINTNYAP